MGHSQYPNSSLLAAVGLALRLLFLHALLGCTVTPGPHPHCTHPTRLPFSSTLFRSYRNYVVKINLVDTLDAQFRDVCSTSTTHILFLLQTYCKLLDTFQLLYFFFLWLAINFNQILIIVFMYIFCYCINI